MHPVPRQRGRAGGGLIHASTYRTHVDSSTALIEVHDHQMGKYTDNEVLAVTHMASLLVVTTLNERGG